MSLRGLLLVKKSAQVNQVCKRVLPSEMGLLHHYKPEWVKVLGVVLRSKPQAMLLSFPLIPYCSRDPRKLR